MRVPAVCVVLLILPGNIPPASVVQSAGAAPSQAAPAAAAAFTPAALDEIVGPIALYPDQLLAQMMLCAQDPPKVQELSGWLVRNSELTGTALQGAAERHGFEPSFVVMTLFPQVVNFMADNIDWTRQLGQAVAKDRKAVLDSVQRLRAKAMANGTLKSTQQQTVQTKTTASGEPAIVIEPANPQVVYVPQYNSQVVYTQPATTTTVIVKEEDKSAEAAAAGALVGFAAGIAIGAAMDNDYYYGPYGFYGGAHMYNDAWDDWYDDREDAREDFYDHREDAREDYYENRENAREDVQNRNRDTSTQQQRTENRQNRQSTGAKAQTTGTQATAQRADRSASATSAESRGKSGGDRQTNVDRSGSRSDAFSGYSSGRSERSASARGERSRSKSSSRSGGRRR